MHLVSIQVGTPKTVEWKGHCVSTGIFKSPIPGPVWVRHLNIDGDRQADLRFHGGTDKAVYAYSLDAYPWWKKVLKRDILEPGAFGENLTISELDERNICLGDILSLGECRLQVAQPRFPCHKLAIKLSEGNAVKTFFASGRPGIYFRVLREGRIQAGDELSCVDSDPERVSVAALFGLKQSGYSDRELMARMLRVKSLGTEWREKFEKKLVKE